FVTNRDLEAMCQEGTFRLDLLERMNGVRIHMPPLRQMLAEAPDDLGYYIRAFIAKKIRDPARVTALTEKMVASLHATRPGHLWPRNLRELEHDTQRFLLGEGPEEIVLPIPPAEATGPSPDEDAPESVCW